MAPKKPKIDRPSGDFDSIIDRELKSRSSESTLDNLEVVRRKVLALRSELLPTQLDMLQDPAKHKAAICTRRAGKTYFTRQAAIEAALNNPWSDPRKAQPVIQYIAQTQKKALDLFWTPFKRLCERVGLDAHWDDSNLRCQLPNGVLVRAAGADSADDLEKYRGDAYALVIIDEAASFGAKIEGLIMEGLAMAMIDYRGTIIMTGTPGAVKAGYFYEVYMGAHPQWSVQPCWTFMDNYHLDKPGEPSIRSEDWVKSNMGPLDSPRVQREAFGRWVTDNSTLVYQYDAARNEWAGVLPGGHDWKFLLGIDVGWRDPTAFVVGAYAKTHPWLFVVHSESSPHLLPSQIEAKIGQLKTQYNVTRIVMDTGGSMARNNMEEWNMRSQFGIIAADKTKKLDFIEHMNSEFHVGRIKVIKGLSVIEEWKVLPWEDEKLDKDNVRHDQRPKEHSGFANHETDAALYMFKESVHYRSVELEPPPDPTSPDYWAKQQRDAKLKAFKSLGRKGWDYTKIRN